MKRAVLIISLLWLACSGAAFAQVHPPQAVVQGWYIDTSRKVLAQFRGARLAHLQRKYGVRNTVATVTFVVHRSGRVEAAHVSQSSGNPALDQTLENIVRSMRLPPIPAAFPNQRVKLGQQIVFY